MATFLLHSAKGSTWKKHKYIKIVNGRYIYPKTIKKTTETFITDSDGNVRSVKETEKKKAMTTETIMVGPDGKVHSYVETEGEQKPMTKTKQGYVAELERQAAVNKQFARQKALFLDNEAKKTFEKKAKNVGYLYKKEWQLPKSRTEMNKKIREYNYKTERADAQKEIDYNKAKRSGENKIQTLKTTKDTNVKKYQLKSAKKKKKKLR